jgi:hypothetical protein
MPDDQKSEKKKIGLAGERGRAQPTENDDAAAAASHDAGACVCWHRTQAQARLVD